MLEEQQEVKERSDGQQGAYGVSLVAGPPFREEGLLLLRIF